MVAKPIVSMSGMTLQVPSPIRRPLQDRLKSVATAQSGSFLGGISGGHVRPYWRFFVLDFIFLGCHFLKEKLGGIDRVWYFILWRAPRWSHLALRLATQIEQLVNKMQTVYDNLAQYLSEATVQPETFDKNLDIHMRFRQNLHWL